jgi:glutamine amidotransferase/cyclase
MTKGTVHVIDVESGNLQSLSNALDKLGYNVEFIRNQDDMAKAQSNAERVLLPGVGNFGHFMDQVNDRQLAEPIREYIRSGKPLMGICVGLQALFTGSVEAPNARGLDLISGTLQKFDENEKSVPHIGWNSADVYRNDNKAMYSIEPRKKYYFVHSYAAPASESLLEQLSKTNWKYSIAQYGNEKFIAALARDNVFLTQFHPEKSGKEGLEVINSFLNGTAKGADITGQRSTGITRRVIACLDVRTNDQGDIVVTKGDQYNVREKTAEGEEVRNLGKPVEVAEKYYKQGADEVTFLNITSFRNSPLRDLPMLEILRLTSKTVFVPLTIGGGIKDTLDPSTGKVMPALDVASLYFRSGADKVSIGTEAVLIAEAYYANGCKGTGKSPIETISRAYGAQAVVISVDPKRVYVESPEDVKHHTFRTKFPGPNGEEFVWYQCTVKGGREARDIGAYELVRACAALGAGEVLLNCIDKDGTNSGFDLELVNDIKSAVTIPVIASSGAGKPEHFCEVFQNTSTDAALGAGMFHRDEYKVSDVKERLSEAGLAVRV